MAYARRKGALILFDAAYECFVSDESLPRSIFEIEGARECARRVLLLLKDRGLHRHPLRLYRGAHCLGPAVS